MTKEQRVFVWVMVATCAVGAGAVVLDVVSSVKARHDAKLSLPPVKVVRDGWKEAYKAGAPIYRFGEQPADWSTLDPLPASKAYVLTGNGVAFATDDLAEVRRWYAQLTFPALDYSQWKDVRYVYEVTAARVDKDADGVPHLVVTIHEARTGCVAPACDPVHDLPNYDRTYEVPVSRMTIHIERGVNA